MDDPQLGNGKQQREEANAWRAGIAALMWSGRN